MVAQIILLHMVKHRSHFQRTDHSVSDKFVYSFVKWTSIFGRSVL